MSLDTLDTNSGSPYSHGKHWRRLEQFPGELQGRLARPLSIVNYNRQESFDVFNAPGSPYHIRKPIPALEKSRLWVEHQRKHQQRQHDDDEWKSSQESGLNLNRGGLSDDDDDDNRHGRSQKRVRQHHGSNQSVNESRLYEDPEDRIHHHQLQQQEQSNFPIILQSVRRMKHLRQRLRRFPEHHGTRAIRSSRVINKAGERNVQFLNLPQKSVRFVKDLVTTLVEEQWRYTLTAFTLSFFGSWILFAILWYLVAYAHGDLDFDPETGERLGDGAQPCVDGATTFAGFLLFSIETQVSTGYGAKVPTEECAEALFLLIVQIIVGLVIDASMVGIVYAKMVRPPKKISDMKFSKKAVICQRDGKLCFVFRLCDVQQQHGIETKVKAVMLEQRRSLEGEVIEKNESYMNLENDGRILLMWPVTICHLIDHESPLFDVSAKDLLEKKFEIIITLTGGTKTTGQVTEARTSYLPGEIWWGHRFQNIILYDRAHEHYVAHNEHVDAIEQVDTPLCSARRLEEVFQEVTQFMEHDREREFDGVESKSEQAGQQDEDSDSDGGLQMEQLKESCQLPKDENNSNQPKRVEIPVKN
ncbi:ATP-sensitive inward rectifier potassium channel 12-like [Ochlerotatus camptorhynchus]|uniref:ATP-sensitive inward rectifier potassium channel 12-like n=1 Tax=Ochlerotatus camptorhynchus TaxID=644619 RepID=UPI0031D2A7FD